VGAAAQKIMQDMTGASALLAVEMLDTLITVGLA
jgi:hypothetical protein